MKKVLIFVLLCIPGFSRAAVTPFPWEAPPASVWVLTEYHGAVEVPVDAKGTVIDQPVYDKADRYEQCRSRLLPRGVQCENVEGIPSDRVRIRREDGECAVFERTARSFTYTSLHAAPGKRFLQRDTYKHSWSVPCASDTLGSAQ